MNKKILYIGSLLLYLVAVSQQTHICDDIRKGNAHKYSISEINDCASVLIGALHDEKLVNCPELKCSGKECLFGYEYDEHGCPTCHCLEGGKEGLFESDIVLTKESENFLKKKLDVEGPLRERRGAAKYIRLWNQFKIGNNYYVPYVISSNMGVNGTTAIAEAIADFSKHTCIRLFPLEGKYKQHLYYSNGQGCSSPVGRVQSQQKITLGEGCWDKGTVIHETLHSLGFWHEQSRPDRDDHVRIHFENIPRDLAFNFNKFTRDEVDSLGSPYDIGSVMHYSSDAFSTNGLPTITDLDGNRLQTQRNELSESDIQQLNTLYGCKKTKMYPKTECTDNHTNCPFMSNLGFCNHNYPREIRNNCKKSCSLCSVGVDVFKRKHWNVFELDNFDI